MKRKFTGKVVSNKMEKTLVVAVERMKEHPIYKKKFKVTKRFQAHVENQNDFNIGDIVVLEESKPLSKNKRWVVAVNGEKVSKEKE